MGALLHLTEPAWFWAALGVLFFLCACLLVALGIARSYERRTGVSPRDRWR